MKTWRIIERILFGGDGSGYRGHSGGRGGPGNPGGSRPRSAGLVNSSYFSHGPGQDLIAGLDAATKEEIINAFSDNTFIKHGHLSGLVPFTEQVPSVLGSWERTFWSGCYNPRTGEIHINPKKKFSMDYILAHELGHHYYETLASKTVHNEIGKRARLLHIAYQKATLFEGEDSGKWLAMRGLRDYSVKGMGYKQELPAEIFSVLASGSKAQISALANDMELADKELSELFTGDL